MALTDEESRKIDRVVDLLSDCRSLLFIKRHDPGGLYHMVHQFYGFGAKSGGGMFVLCDPFSDEPKLVDLLQFRERQRFIPRRVPVVHGNVTPCFGGGKINFDSRFCTRLSH